MFAVVMVKSTEAMLLLTFFLAIAVILFGSLIYECEKGEWSDSLGGYARPDVTGSELELTPFTSIPLSFWWVLVTVTTVGYGDNYPTSVLGKVVGVVTMMLGILALALPVSIIGSNFSREFRKFCSLRAYYYYFFFLSLIRSFPHHYKRGTP